MSTEVVMPQMGESITEGTIVKWHKKPGERIDRDEPLFEITTDKVDTEVPAPAAGVLEQILVQEGETVAVGTVVATLGNASAAETAAASAEPKASAGHFRSSHEPKTFQRKAPPPQPLQAARHPAPAAPAAPAGGGGARGKGAETLPCRDLTRESASATDGRALVDLRLWTRRTDHQEGRTGLH